MSLLERIFQAARRLDRAVYAKSGAEKIVTAIKPKIPLGMRKIGARYGPFVAVIAAVILFAAALSSTRPERIETADRDGLGVALPGEEGGDSLDGVFDEDGAAADPGSPAARRAAVTFPGQRAAPGTANICGLDGLLDTGPVVQSPYAVQCLDPFTGDNGGATSRGVERDAIHVAYYVTIDPQIKGTVAAGGGCRIDRQEDCWDDYLKAFMDWNALYYQTYGREVKLHKFRGSGRENNVEAAIQDARRIANYKPEIFAVLGGPGEAGSSFAEELKANGIICFCTVSLPQEFYEKNSPYVFSNLMASTQAYIHRSEYVGKRLAHRKAAYAGAPELGRPDLRQMNRSFALVWFDNTRGDYATGIAFFKDRLKEYNVTLATDIRYENIEGCQTNAANIVQQIFDAQPTVTSVIFSGDPICPIDLTVAAEAQRAKWEWIITGSVLTDSNNLARLYERNQWSRAFGVSMLQPDVANEHDYWYKMWKQMRPDVEPMEDAQLFVAGPIMFYTGVHLAGAKLTRATFRDGLAKAVPRGGTPTLPRASFGPKKVGAFSFWDHNRFDDMTEIWWDNTASDPNGNARAYRYVDGGKRWAWGTWPSTDVKVFQVEGTVTGYQEPPDQ